MLTKWECIPEQLKRYAIFLCYAADKTPISAVTGRSKNWHLTSSLCDFETAKQYAEKYGLGIGVAFTANSPIFGIDVDGARNLQTATLETWASEIIELMPDLYWETSMSGTGLKGVGLGTYQTHFAKIAVGPPIHGGRNQQIEFKTCSGYFALTGQAI